MCVLLIQNYHYKLTIVNTHKQCFLLKGVNLEDLQRG